MLDKRTRLAYFNGLVLPHLDYADTIRGDQPGLTLEMQQLHAFQNRFAKKIAGGKLSSAEALASLKWFPLPGVGNLDIDVSQFRMKSREMLKNAVLNFYATHFIRTRKIRGRNTL